jgi:hypothetical protein
MPIRSLCCQHAAMLARARRLLLVLAVFPTLAVATPAAADALTAPRGVLPCAILPGAIRPSGTHRARWRR